MKKLIALLLAAVMLLSMTACGGSAEPVETAPATTEAPTTAPTETPTEEPTEVPTEALTEPVISAEELLQSEDTVTVTDKTPAEYWQILLDLGYIELWTFEARENPYYPKDYELISLTYNDKAFRLDLTAIDYYVTGNRYEGFILYGIKEAATGNANITGIAFEDESTYFKSIVEGPVDTGISADVAKKLTDLDIPLPFIKEESEYSVPMENAPEDFDMERYALYEMPLIYHVSYYYPATGNIYNFVREAHGALDAWPNIPSNILNTEWQMLLKHSFEKEIIPYGEFTVELNKFCVQYGGELAIYQYRPGMSFSDWACSELNTDGWIPWYEDSVLSPDRKYIASTGYLSLDEILGDGAVLNAEVFDGKLDHTHDIEYHPVDGVSVEDMKSEKMEVVNRGNINIPVAHMVNARTPLFTPGFRILGREEGRAAYHSVEMANVGYLQDDILDIYMNGIADELIPHIKLYAFPESEEFMDSLGESLILNVHPTPLAQGDAMLTIPENAVCLTFQRVPDGEEAPDTPNPYKPGHENLNKDAVFARYVTKDDPNFGEDVNLVFAITFDDELVYWIHMGSNFYRAGEVISNIRAMGY